MDQGSWAKRMERDIFSYVCCERGFFPNDLQQKLTLLDHFPNDPMVRQSINAILLPVASIQFNLTLKHDSHRPEMRKMVYIFITVAVLVLVMAVVNYINLATARHTHDSGKLVSKSDGCKPISACLCSSRRINHGFFHGDNLGNSYDGLCRPALAYIADEKFFRYAFYHKAVLLLFAGLVQFGIIFGLFSLYSYSPVSNPWNYSNRHLIQR